MGIGMKAKSVLITGASGNLGRELTSQFLAAGFTVYGTHHRSEAGAGLPQNPNLHWVPVDLGDTHSIEESFQKLTREAEIDVLVHAAGGFRYANLDQTSDEDIEFLLNANLKSGFLISRALIPGMKKRNFGRLVFIGAKSVQNPSASAGMSIYVATKAGLVAFAEALQSEVKTFDININTLLPSVIDSPMNRRDMPKADFSTWVTPAHLSQIVMSLVGDWGNVIRGANIPVNGKV